MKMKCVSYTINYDISNIIVNILELSSTHIVTNVTMHIPYSNIYPKHRKFRPPIDLLNWGKFRTTFWRNHLPFLEREPCKGVMRKACRVADIHRNVTHYRSTFCISEISDPNPSQQFLITSPPDRLTFVTIPLFRCVSNSNDVLRHVIAFLQRNGGVRGFNTLHSLEVFHLSKARRKRESKNAKQRRNTKQNCFSHSSASPRNNKQCFAKRCFANQTNICLADFAPRSDLFQDNEHG